MAAPLQALTKWRLQEREERHSMEPSYSQSCCTLTSFNHVLFTEHKAPIHVCFEGIVDEEDNHISVLSDGSEQCAYKLKMNCQTLASGLNKTLINCQQTIRCTVPRE
ncbi:hypothetical protein ROHU_000615 [Labeo rohita]|uniref:Uncharacterized protein n=1 Tax=Labeo rohita TaxID=84645 RepID=A0A498P421_LABRO|nr:hypothetical protein ROHU_004878 [Labeo rohita]RXN38965.1 hypothetical protein ROHU_000615 [Labeo rohita]